MMRCRETPARLVDRDLARERPGARRELERHLAGCPACRARAADESELTDALRALARAPAPAIDVTARVARSLRALPPPRRAELPPGRAAVAAGLVALAIVSLTAALAPAPGVIAREAAPLAESLGHALSALAEPLRVVAGPLLRIAGNLLHAAAVLAAWSRPATTAALASGLVVVLLTIATVLARDLAPRSAGRP
jgi:hypothetical protein